MKPNLAPRLMFLWILITIVVVTSVLLQRMRSEESAVLASDEGGMVEERPSDSDAASGLASAEGPRIAPVSIESQLAAKLTIALHRLAPTLPSQQILGQAEPLKQGAFADQLGYAVLLGSIDGWERGVEFANGIALPNDSLDEAKALREGVVSAMQLRKELASSGDADGEGARNVAEPLRPTMRYFVDVLGPEAGAKAVPTIVTLVGAGVWYLLAILGGLLAIGILVLFVRPRALFAPAEAPHASVVLGETFLLWIVSFLGLNIVSAIVIDSLRDQLGAAASIGFSVAVMFSSLAALAYPRVRGVSWRELRALVGLHAGKGVVPEAVQGFLCYLCSVPLLVAGLVLFFVLSLIAKAIGGPTPPPSHPVVEVIGGAGVPETVMLYLLAAVAAPIVEETMFRGCLYGHLRSVVAPRVRVASFIVSALVSSSIFAMIHPQGLLFAPALGGLAIGFCAFRELRGSLIAPIVAHGVNNAVTLTLALTLMG